MNPRRYRLSRGLTLDDMAALLGVSNRSVVSKHELGRHLPSIEIIAKYREVSGGLIQFEDWEDLRLNPPQPGDFEDYRAATPDELQAAKERKRA